MGGIEQINIKSQTYYFCNDVINVDNIDQYRLQSRLTQK